MSPASDLQARARELLSQPTPEVNETGKSKDAEVAAVAEPAESTGLDSGTAEDLGQAEFDLDLTQMTQVFTERALGALDLPEGQSEKLVALVAHLARVTAAQIEHHGRSNSSALEPIVDILAKVTAMRKRDMPGVDLTPAVLIKEMANLALANGESAKKLQESALLGIEVWLKDGKGKAELEALQSNLEIQRATFETRKATAVQAARTQLRLAEHSDESVVHNLTLARIARPPQIAAEQARADGETLRVKAERGPRERGHRTRIAIEDNEGPALQELDQRAASVETRRRQSEVVLSERIAELDETKGIEAKGRAHELSLEAIAVKNIETEAEILARKAKATRQRRIAAAKVAVAENKVVRFSIIGGVAALTVLGVRACNADDKFGTVVEPVGSSAVTQDLGSKTTTSTVKPAEASPTEINSSAATSLPVLPQRTQAPEQVLAL